MSTATGTAKGVRPQARGREPSGAPRPPSGVPPRPATRRAAAFGAGPLRAQLAGALARDAIP